VGTATALRHDHRMTRRSRFDSRRPSSRNPSRPLSRLSSTHVAENSDLQALHAGGGTRTPDTRIMMLPLRLRGFVADRRFWLWGAILARLVPASFAAFPGPSVAPVLPLGARVLWGSALGAIRRMCLAERGWSLRARLRRWSLPALIVADRIRPDPRIDRPRGVR
jgi:hypothetical protein